MLTASEAAKIAYSKRIEGLDKDKQLRKVLSMVEESCKKGERGILLDEELICIKELNELGYSYSSGYGTNSKSWSIHW
jgi:hypothetical protein